jgi:hypothetical protein
MDIISQRDGFQVQAYFKSNRGSPIETFVDGIRRTLNDLRKQAVALGCELRMDHIHMDEIPDTDETTLYRMRSVVYEREGITGAQGFSD